MEGESLVGAEGCGLLVINPYVESIHKPGTAFSTLLEVDAATVILEMEKQDRGNSLLMSPR